MKKLGESFIIAFSMYSKIPMPRCDWREDNMSYAMCFWPLVGAVIGALWYIWGIVRMHVDMTQSFFAAILLLIPFLITGGIHLDGLLDTADAMSSWQTKERRLEILKDSHAGAFAVICGASYMVLYLGAAGEVTKECLPALCLGFCVSRTFSALSVENFPNANPKGTAAAFGKNSLKQKVNAVLAFYLVLLAAASVFLDPLSGLLMMAAAALCFAFYHHMALKYFGGITGDLAGFYVCISELAMVLAVVIGNRIAGLIG